jgi:hypothetical protein
MVKRLDAPASDITAGPCDQPKSLLSSAQQQQVKLLLQEARDVSTGAKKARERLIALFEACVRAQMFCAECQSDCNIAILLIIDGFLVNDKPVEQLISRITKVIVSFGKRYKRGNYASNILDAFPEDKKWQADLEAVLCTRTNDDLIDMPSDTNIINNVYCQQLADAVMLSVSPGTLELLIHWADNPDEAYRKYAATPKRLKKIVGSARERIRKIIGT